jgi:hypothetical protein
MARRWKREGPSLTATVRADQRRIAHYATDKATTLAKDLTRQAIKGAGLGRLANAVGSTSSLRKKGGRTSDNAWGAIFARGKTASRGNQALLAYSEGADIVPTSGKKWLAFATDALPKRAGRYKMTPARYKASGLEQTLGKLRFVPGKGGRVAYLVAKKVVVSKRSGRILRQQGGKMTRGSNNKDSIIAFILIRYTRRAQRFDQKRIMMQAIAEVPTFAFEFQKQNALR